MGDIYIEIDCKMKSHRKTIPHVSNNFEMEGEI